MSDFNMNDFAGELFDQKKRASKMKIDYSKIECKKCNNFVKTDNSAFWANVCDTCGTFTPDSIELNKEVK